MSRADYGIDAPGVPRGFALVVALGLVGAAVGGALGWRWLVSLGVVNAAWFGGSLALYLYATRIGKHRVWAELLDGVRSTGDETAVDVGCGRGAVLVQLARRLPRGKVHGVDLWSSVDQSGNAEAVTRANAEAEGVADRVVLHTGDMRQLPLADGSVHLVVSSLAVHNVPDAEGRRTAIREMWRVLAPGGTLLVADIQYARRYADALAELGATVERRSLGWRFWYGGPWMATSLVSARKSI